MPYATLVQLKTYLGIDTPDADALLEQCLSRAQAIIEAPAPFGTGRVFEAALDTTCTFHAIQNVQGRRLWLNADLCQIATVTNGDGAVIPSSQYVTAPLNTPPFYAIDLKANATSNWTWSGAPEGAISITGRWAYSVTAPIVITELTIDLAAWLFRRKDTPTDPDRAIVSPDGVTLLPSELPRLVRSGIAALRPRGRIL